MKNKTKNKLAMLSMMASMMAMEEGFNPYDEEVTHQKPPKKSKESILKEKGVNKYYYGDNVVYARNKKNADRKAKNKGFI